MCKAIDNAKAGSNTFEKLYGAANVYYNYTGKVSCFHVSDDSDPHGLAEWQWQVRVMIFFNCTDYRDDISVIPFRWYDFQACTEMIMPMSGSSARSIFPPHNYSSTARAQSCYISNGVQIRPNWITTEFGGHVSFIISSHNTHGTGMALFFSFFFDVL